MCNNFYSYLTSFFIFNGGEIKTRKYELLPGNFDVFCHVFGGGEYKSILRHFVFNGGQYTLFAHVRLTIDSMGYIGHGDMVGMIDMVG